MEHRVRVNWVAAAVPLAVDMMGVDEYDGKL